MKKISLASFIIKTRESKGINSARELARKAGLSHTPVIHIENGKTLNPTIDTLISIARALNIPVMHIVLAAQGKDPESMDNTTSYREAIEKIYNNSPKEVMANLLKAMNSEERRQFLLDIFGSAEEIKRLFFQ